ncbi:MAG TPA: DinB family protein [Polyangiaceae bacterium]|nr:DinB family protein [Polyangiaceae bacterium]
MSELDTARLLTRYNAWANETLFDAVERLPAGEAVKPRQSLFSNMVHTLHHNYIIDRIFQAHLEGRPHGYATRSTPDYPPLPELRQQQRDIDRWYIEYSQQLTDAALNELIEFTFVGGGPGAMTRYEMLLHVVNHTSYHRGFVADLFYQVPAVPPVTDLPVFTRRERYPHSTT